MTMITPHREMTETETTPPKKSKPKLTLTLPVWSILLMETGERFAFYGYRAVLVLYFTRELDYDENQAISLYAYTLALAYLSPIVGALLADGQWGRYLTILVFGGIYVVGLIILTISAMGGGSWDDNLRLQRWVTMLGLMLICLGTGGIKPCVSAFGADQVETMQSKPKNEPAESFIYGSCSCNPIPEDIELDVFANELPVDTRETSGEILLIDDNREEQVRVFFACFYFCINVGAVTSIAVIPMIRGMFGFGVAFLLPTIFMIVAMILFLAMRSRYICHLPDDGSSLSTTFKLCKYQFRKNIWPYVPTCMERLCTCLRPGPIPTLKHRRNRDMPINSKRPTTPSNEAQEGAQDGLIKDYTTDPDHESLEQHLEDAKQALRVLPIMAFFPIFWCLYDQQSSVWTLQAARMELNGLQPEQLQAINPIEIVVLVPLFDRYIYPWLDCHGVNIRPLRRMSWGMLLTAIAFFMSGFIETTMHSREANNEPSVNVFWQIPQITLVSIAEILVSVTGLEFVYATSPDRLKAFLMAVFLVTTAIGDFMGGILYSTVFVGLDRALAMYICGFLMVANMVFFCGVAHWWEAKEAARNHSRNPKQSSSDIIETQTSLPLIS